VEGRRIAEIECELSNCVSSNLTKLPLVVEMNSQLTPTVVYEVVSSLAANS